MADSKQGWSDQQIDNIIGNLLRMGVVLSAFVVLLGGTLYLIRHGLDLPSYRVFHGEPTDLCSIRGIIREALAFHAEGVIQFGLLMLVATPILRVAFTVLAFALQRDKTYVIVTLTVLGILIFSLTGGGR